MMSHSTPHRRLIDRHAALVAERVHLRDEYLARDAQYAVTIAELAKLIQATHDRRWHVRLARWVRRHLPEPQVA